MAVFCIGTHAGRLPAAQRRNTKSDPPTDFWYGAGWFLVILTRGLSDPWKPIESGAVAGISGRAHDGSRRMHFSRSSGRRDNGCALLPAAGRRHNSISSAVRSDDNMHPAHSSLLDNHRSGIRILLDVHHLITTVRVHLTCTSNVAIKHQRSTTIFVTTVGNNSIHGHN